MGELIAGLVGLFLALAVVTVVGHGLWVLMARMFGGGEKRQREDHHTTCPRCFAPFRWGQTTCDLCGWPSLEIDRQRPQQVHQALHRLLYRLRELGLLDPEQFKLLLKSVGAVLRIEKQPSATLTAATTAAPAEPAEESAPPVMEAPAEMEVLAEPAEKEAAAPLFEPVPADEAKTPAAAVGPVEPVRPEVEVAGRAEQYSVHRKTAAASATPAPPSAPPKSVTQQAWGRIVASFLEEKNIRWGELAGGLLIVFSSIALVISFWAEIAERPLLKFGIFNGVSAALFGVGFYTDRRWKIHTTSHSVLIIAMLLVPLNFLAIAAFTASSPPTELLSLAGEGVSIVLFAALVVWAARTLTPHAPWAAAVGVMLPAVWQLLIRRFVDAESTLTLAGTFATAPLAVFAAAAGVSLVRTAGNDQIDEPAASRHFILSGLALFATLLCLGLLLFKSGDPLFVLRRLAPLLVALGMPLLATGIVLGRRIAVALAGLRTGAASVGVLGAMVIAASIALSWPLPAQLVIAAGLSASTFALLARLVGVPPANYVAAACLALGWLVSGAVLGGDVSWFGEEPRALVAAVVSADGGASLAPLAAVLVAIAIACRRLGWREDELAWAQSAAAAVVASVALLAVFGLGRVGDPEGVFWLFSLYAFGATVAAGWLNHRALSWAAVGLLAAAVVQGVVYRYGDGWTDVAAWATALLLHATVSLGVGSGVDRLRRESAGVFRDVFSDAAVAASILATAALAGGWAWIPYATLAVDFLWLALVWFVLAWQRRDARLFTAFQIGLATAVCTAVLSRVATYDWYQSAERPWFDPWFRQAIGVALAAYALVWHAVRYAAGRVRLSQGISRRLNELLNPPWPGFDRLCELSVAVLVVLMAIYAAVPGTGQELSPLDARTSEAVPLARFELPYAPSAHAAGGGAWLLWGGAAVALVAGLWEQGAGLRLLGLLVLAAAACPLAAAEWVDQRAVASATRWFLASFAVVASLPLWARRQVRGSMESVGIAPEPPPDWLARSLAQAARAVIVAAVLLHYLAFALFVSGATISAAGVPTALETLLGWLAALAVFAGVVWLILGAAASRIEVRERPSQSTGIVRNLFLLTGIAPLGVAFAFVVASGLIERPLAGPAAGSWFAQIGNSALYGGPLLLFAVALLGHAVRERSSGYALSFGLLANVVATLIYLLEISAAGRPLDAVAWVEVAQLNALVAAVIALGWWVVMTWLRQRSGSVEAGAPGQLVTLALLATALCVPTFLAGCVGVFVDPTGLTWEAEVASPLGLAATALAVVAVIVVTGRRWTAFTAHHVALLTVAVVAAATMIAARYDSGNWHAYRVLLVGTALAGWVTATVPRRLQSVAWSTCFAVLATVAALRYRGVAPGWSWEWLTVAVLLAVYGLLLRLAWISGRRRFLWWSGATLCVAADVWVTEVWLTGGGWDIVERAVDYISFQCLTLAVAAILSVVVEWSWTRGGRNDLPNSRSLGFHRFAVWPAIFGLLMVAGVGLLADAADARLDVTGWFAYAALVATAVAIAASLWDVNIRWPVTALYCLGLVSVGTFLDSLNVRGGMFDWALAQALAAFALASSYLWSRREGFAKVAERLGAPEDLLTRRDSTGWMVTANSLVAVVVTALVFRIQFVDPDFTQRMTAAYAVLAGALALALLTVGRVGPAMRGMSLALGALFAVAFAWAWVAPSIAAPGLHRLVASVVALAAVIPVYGFGFVKFWRRESEWTPAAQRTIPWLAGASGVLLLVTLGVETAYFLDAGEAPLAWPALLAVIIALTGLAIAALAAALLPGRDPLGLSERGRTVYVYAAEALLGLLFLHVRVTMPWLFRGWFLQYWPLVVMAIAFVGVGLSELFRRLRQRVLAEPLENTGALLPLLPVIGYWVRPEVVAVDYALVLLGVGALYTALSVLRKSPLFAALAALAVNGSLWSLWNSSEGLGLLEHPQLWLIPPLVCVLVGAHLNRQQLSKEQMTSLRYLCAVMIYASSTADVFINGVGQAPWLPLVLAGLSICGIFAGIMMRVRAFLFLGLAFLLVSLLTVIWHAAVELEHTWVWWVSGIVAGVAIIALFGLFEKKRNEMLALVERVKQWEA